MQRTADFLVSSPLINAFFDNIDKNFFTPKFDTYEYMTFFNNPDSFKWLVLGIYFGLVIASVVMFFNKTVLGGFIRTLDKNGCLSDEKALALDELGYAKNIFIKLSLKYGNTLRRVVSYTAIDADNSTRVGGNLKESGIAGSRLDFDRVKFYLPSEKRDAAVQRFDGKGSRWINILAVTVIGIIVVVIIFKLAPFLVGLAENTLAGFSADASGI